MAGQQEWTIDFYSREDETSPVREFIESLDEKTQARFIWSIEQLRQLNVRAREPMVKHIEGKIWELRRASDGNIYRLFYFFFVGRKIVFLHGFQKKTDKTQRRSLISRNSEWMTIASGKEAHKTHGKKEISGCFAGRKKLSGMAG